MEKRKVKGGLKSKGFRNAPAEKMPKQMNESEQYAKCEQAAGKTSAPKVSHQHKVIGKDM
jgi:hypothetical protein